MKITLTSDLHYGFEGKVTTHILTRFFAELARAEPDMDMLVIAGDMTQGVRFMDPCLALIRKALPDLPIAVVLGNHDYWGIGRNQHEFVKGFRGLLQAFIRHGVRYLPNGPYISSNGIHIYGFDGWYWNSNPPTNDIKYMPATLDGVPIHDHMYIRCRNDVEHILDMARHDQAGSRHDRIIVTHFEPNDNVMGGNTAWLEPLSEYFETMLTGHTHRPADYVCDDNAEKPIHIYNSGSDYDRPNYIIINL